MIGSWDAGLPGLGGLGHCIELQVYCHVANARPRRLWRLGLPNGLGGPILHAHSKPHTTFQSWSRMGSRINVIAISLLQDLLPLLIQMRDSLSLHKDFSDINRDKEVPRTFLKVQPHESSLCPDAHHIRSCAAQLCVFKASLRLSVAVIMLSERICQSLRPVAR